MLGVPVAALGVGGWLAWGGTLYWHDLVVLAITYTLTGLGITVGYHRLFTHRSFKTTRAVRALLAVFGSMAVEGPVIEWVSTHRKHHRFSDRPGDPHSPHAETAPGWRGALRGLAHAHVGWMFRGKDMANPRRYAKDLLADRDLRFISRTFPLWVAVGLALPFGLGVALTGSIAGGLTGLLWGGAVRDPDPASRDLQHQLAVPLLRPPPVRHRRRVAQPRVAGSDRVRRGLAQQPPRLPDLRPSRPGPRAGRPRRLADQRARALPPGVGRRPDQPRQSAGQARGPSPSRAGRRTARCHRARSDRPACRRPAARPRRR